MYYDANITLDTEEDEDAECTDDDMVYIGEEMARFVKEFETNYPKYSKEFIETTLCTMPDSELLEIAEVDDDDEDEEFKADGAHITVIQNGGKTRNFRLGLLVLQSTP